MTVLTEKTTKTEISEAIKEIVAENPNVHNPMIGTRCIYSKLRRLLEQGEAPNCIVGAVFVHFDWELPHTNMAIVRSVLARNYMDNETVEWLNKIQSTFDEFSRNGGTWSDALSECVRKGLI